MTAEEEKKVKSQALAEARVRYGAKKDPVDITDKEWEAIQAGAIHTQMLRDILNNTDKDIVLECSNLSYISSSGLRIFLNIRKNAATKGKKVTVKNINDEIRKVFQMTGFMSLFEIA